MRKQTLLKKKFPLAAAAICGVLLSCTPAGAQGLNPPWNGGKNNPALHKGLDITVAGVDNLPDFHGDPAASKLSIFVGGNYYFAMAPLVRAFEKAHPALRGKIYYETVPPGLLSRQIANGGTVTVGNMTWTVKADVYAAGLKRVKAMEKQGRLAGAPVPYVTNDLAIMVPKGNPAHITTLKDLGKPGVRLVMPNPKWEGIARQIQLSLKKAGGDALEKTVYETKVENGETILTHIHHRQSPMFLMEGKADAGVTWKSEAVFQESIGNPISHINIPAAHNTTAIYAAGVLKQAPHPQAARAWVNFLTTPAALRIFKRYGFKPYVK